MKKILLLLFVCFSIAQSGRSQNWTKVYGGWEYQNFKVDSAIYLPSGNTATRKAPVVGSYWIRYNTDSSTFELSNGVKWFETAIKPPMDYYYLTTTADIHDTTIVTPCGTYTCTYSLINAPQFIGFRMRLLAGNLNTMEGPNYCPNGYGFFVWDPIGGKLYNFGDGAGDPLVLRAY